MNADASAGVHTDARLGLRIPGLFGTALGATIGGGVLTLLGIGLLIWGIAAKRRRTVPRRTVSRPRTGRRGTYHRAATRRAVTHHREATHHRAD